MYPLQGIDYKCKIVTTGPFIGNSLKVYSFLVGQESILFFATMKLANSVHKTVPSKPVHLSQVHIDTANLFKTCRTLLVCFSHLFLGLSRCLCSFCVRICTLRNACYVFRMVQFMLHTLMIIKSCENQFVVLSILLFPFIRFPSSILIAPI